MESEERGTTTPLKLRNKDIKHAKVEHEDGVMGHLAYDYVKD